MSTANPADLTCRYTVISKQEIFKQFRWKKASFSRLWGMSQPSGTDL